MGFHLPPPVASFLTIALILFLFRRDIREKPNISGALWLPLIWLVITCSRSISQWLTILGLPAPGGSSVEEGSPLDASFFFILIAAGFYVLQRRQISLSEIVRNNQWLTVFFAYCLISIVWSDFPFIALKRWIKVLGLPTMALIVLTDPNPEEAVKRLMKRCAYVIVLVSILWIKYYPQLGRGFEPWSGEASNNGIAENKNSLGVDLLILGFFFLWYLLQTWKMERTTWRRRELQLIVGFMIGVGWLFSQASSATALISFAIGALTVVFVGLRSINKNRIGTYVFGTLGLAAAAELLFGISGGVSEALGRGSKMSGRGPLWQALLEFDINPILGTGFESFWLGERPNRLAGLFYYIPNEAHNGYLEIYLTLGIIGLFILIALFVAVFRKIRRELFRNFEWGRYRLGFFVAVVLYNWTEAGFKTLIPISFVFYMIAIDYPRPHLTSSQSFSGVARSKERTRFAYAEREP